MKKNIIASLLLVIVLILGGCGNNEDKETAKPKKQKNKTAYLEMLMTDTLDPLLADRKSVRGVLSVCYEPLFLMDENISPKGILAKSWSIDDEAKKVTVSLKENILWHDGKTLTAADVVYTVEKLKTKPESPYFLAAKYIENAEATDAYTIEFTLTRPYAQFVYSLYFPIEPAHIEELDENIVGTGAYMLEKYIRDDMLVLQKNPSWHGGDAQCSAVEVSIVRDRETGASSFSSGMLSAIMDNSFDLSNNALTKDMRATKYPSAQYEYMAFNHNREPFGSAGVRGAISNAVDREVITADCYGGYAVGANIPLHPRGKDIAPSPTLSAYDLDNAMEMLFYEGYSMDEQSGILKNEDAAAFEFSILVNKENIARCQCADLIASQLLRAGITVKVIRKDFDEYTAMIARGEFDAYLAGTDAANIYDFEFLLSSDGELNNYGYRGNYMDLALSNIASSPSRDSFEDATLNFGEVFVREEPVCGIAFVENVLITSRAVNTAPLPWMFSPYKNLSDWEILRNN